ncbi:hypothetical protein DENIT_12459 [Pseudomonas veronii]|nr:hypothetical protein DENIT_12459 [Pseudomonas veronii]
MPILNRSKTLIAIAVELLDKHRPGLNEVLRSDRPDGGIIRLLSAITASHTDATMLISVAHEQGLVLGVFSGADG